jgi:hypothetical protein
MKRLIMNLSIVALVAGLTTSYQRPSLHNSMAHPLGILATGASSTACDEGPINPASSKVCDLDENAQDWGVYCEGTPTWEKETIATPSLDGQSLRCALTGGQPYSNAHCYRSLLPDPAASTFTLTLSFYISPTTTCNNQPTPSTVQAIEFTVSKWHQSYRYEYALQWQNVGDGTPQWRYWDPDAAPDPWVAFSPPITQCLGGETWHTLTLGGEIANGYAHYTGFTVDGIRHSRAPTAAPAYTPGEPDRLAVAIQLDGNADQSPYDVIIDQVCLVRKPADRVYLPIVMRQLD